METIYCGESMSVRHALLHSLVFCFAVGGINAQTPNAREIVKNVERNLSGVDDYVVDLEAEVDMERLRMPKMKARLYFKKPDKIHFESESFAMLPREGVFLNPTKLLDFYDMKVMGKDSVGTRGAYKLQLAAKDERTRLRQMHLWVDQARWTIIKVETIPYDGRMLSVTLSYELVDGKYWLASGMEMTFGGFLPDTGRSVAGVPPELAPQLHELQRVPRGGSMSVKYSNYRVNTGLKDELFENKTKE